MRALNRDTHEGTHMCLLNCEHKYLCAREDLHAETLIENGDATHHQ